MYLPCLFYPKNNAKVGWWGACLRVVGWLIGLVDVGVEGCGKVVGWLVDMGGNGCGKVVG